MADKLSLTGLVDHEPPAAAPVHAAQAQESFRLAPLGVRDEQLPDGRMVRKAAFQLVTNQGRAILMPGTDQLVVVEAVPVVLKAGIVIANQIPKFTPK